jgi:hypothetical protein
MPTINEYIRNKQFKEHTNYIRKGFVYYTNTTSDPSRLIFIDENLKNISEAEFENYKNRNQFVANYIEPMTTSEYGDWETYGPTYFFVKSNPTDMEYQIYDSVLKDMIRNRQLERGGKRRRKTNKNKKRKSKKSKRRRIS